MGFVFTPSESERAISRLAADSVVYMWAACVNSRVRGVSFVHTRRILWKKKWPLIQEIPHPILNITVGGHPIDHTFGLGANVFSGHFDGPVATVGIQGWSMGFQLECRDEPVAPIGLCVQFVLPKLDLGTLGDSALSIQLHMEHHTHWPYRIVTQPGGVAELMKNRAIRDFKSAGRLVFIPAPPLVFDSERATSQWQVVMGNVARLTSGCEFSLMIDPDEYVEWDGGPPTEGLVNRRDIGCVGCEGPQLRFINQRKRWYFGVDPTEPKVLLGPDPLTTWAYPHWAAGPSYHSRFVKGMQLLHVRNLHVQRPLKLSNESCSIVL